MRLIAVLTATKVDCARDGRKRRLGLSNPQPGSLLAHVQARLQLSLIRSGLLQHKYMAVSSWSCLQKVVSTPRSAQQRARGALEDVGHDVTVVVTWRGENVPFGDEVVLNTIRVR